MKKGIIVIAIIIVVVIFGFVFFGDSQEEPAEPTSVAPPSEPPKPGVRVIGADEIENNNPDQ